jgi:hypothetical protein
MVEGLLAPGAIEKLFARLSVEVQAKVPIALTAVGLTVERQAKINASNGEHPPRTPTPASPGEGPARVSGSLVRAITHTEPQHTGSGWMVQVGMAPGLYPYYNRSTPSSEYAKYLELGMLRNGHAYPFLGPAVEMVGLVSTYTIFRELFGSGLGMI